MKNKISIILFFCLISTSLYTVNAENRKIFIKKYKHIAIQEMHRTGIPASIKLAQGILESGCGRSRLALKANNHFGIKCHSWNGPGFRMDDDKRNECFRKYKNPEQSWIDHSEFLTSRDRYSFLFKLPKTDYKGWARGLKKAGYATAPDYAKKLIRIIEEEELYIYDRQGKRQQNKENKRGIYTSRIVYINNRPCITVKAGDSFELIAQECHISLRKLLKYNDKEETSIRIGMHVFLAKKRNKAPRGYAFHTVRPGDSMYMIAQIYGIKLHKLLQYNYMRNGEKPQIGEKIALRGYASLF